MDFSASAHSRMLITANQKHMWKSVIWVFPSYKLCYVERWGADQCAADWATPRNRKM